MDLIVTLCLPEKCFPPSFFNIMVHLTVHLVNKVRLCGQVYLRWMYLFERYMKILKSYVRNHNRPEGCIAKSYVAEEVLEFCVEYTPNIRQICALLGCHVDMCKTCQSRSPYLVENECKVIQIC